MVALVAIALASTTSSGLAQQATDPALEAWHRFAWTTYFSKVMTTEEFSSRQYDLEAWAMAQGVIFRMQWDKATAAGDEAQKQQLERIWAALMQQAEALSTQRGLAQTERQLSDGTSQMVARLVARLDQGFFEADFPDDPYSQLLSSLGLSGSGNWSGVPSFFEGLANPTCPMLPNDPASTLDSTSYLEMRRGQTGLTHFYFHPQMGLYCGYGAIHSAEFTGEYLRDEGSGRYVSLVLRAGAWVEQATLLPGGTRMIDGYAWQYGTILDATSGSAGEWRARLIRR